MNRNRNADRITLAICLMIVVAIFALVGNTGQSSAMQFNAESTVSGPSLASPTAGSQPTAQTSAEVYSRLEQPIDLDFPTAVSVTQFAGFLKQALGVTCYIDEEEVELAGQNTVDPIIEASLEGVPAKLALRTILRAQDLGYFVNGPMLVLTSSLRAESVLETRVYDVRDLLAADERYVSQYKETENHEQPADGCQIDTIGSLSQLPSGGPTQGAIRHIEPEQRLILMVQETTERSDKPRWFDNGGPGIISIYSGILVVSQSTEVHEEIAELLALLRELQ